MKIKTNIWHVTGDNNLKYDDFIAYSLTVHARNATEAMTKASSEWARLKFDVYNLEPTLVYTNVELDVLAPAPFEVTIDETDFTYDFERQELTVKIAYESSTIQNVRALQKYLNELMVRIDESEAL